MSYGDDALGAMIRRVRLMETDDTGTQQKVRVRGFRNDEPGDVVTLQRWGESGHAPVGSEAVMLALGGRSDRAFILGLEHKDHRPKNANAGDKIIYDAFGSAVRLVQANVEVTHASKIVLKVGGCSLTITSAGFVFAGGAVVHEGRNIGAQHVHGGVTPGAANTSVPA